MQKLVWIVAYIFLVSLYLVVVGCGSSNPQIVSTSPNDEATNVSTNTSITITFGQAVDLDSFKVSINPEAELKISFSSGNMVITAKPKTNLSRNTTYTVTLGSVTFADGSTLDSPLSFSFTTSGKTISVTDKWELWSSDQTHLRGADLHPCRIFDEADKCSEATSQQDVQDLRNLGANLINASYPGLYDQQPPYKLNKKAQKYMDNLISWAEEVGIYVVIHVRTGPGRNEAAITDPEGNALTTVWTDQKAHNAWIAMWRYMAGRYSDSPAVIGYNLMVEPHVNTLLDPDGKLSPQAFAQKHQGTLADWNAFSREITTAIREVDTETPIIINSLQWASASWFPALRPTGDPRTVYSLHAYDPDVYTNQEGVGVNYPSVVEDESEHINFNRNWLEENYNTVLKFAQEHNVPIYVGEYGLFRWVPDATTFIHDQIELFEEYGWNYAYYVWRGDEVSFDGYNIEFGNDRNNKMPIPGNPILKAFTAKWSENVNFPEAK